jgi:hypothetical protein
MIQTTTVTSEKDNGTLSSNLTKSSKLAVDNKEDPGHVGNFHTTMVDNLDEMISETSDLPLFCFHVYHVFKYHGDTSMLKVDMRGELCKTITTGSALRGSAAATSARWVQSVGNRAPTRMSAIVILNFLIPILHL